MIPTICICGAGTMGSGIAQVAAQSGFNTILFDVNISAIDKAKIFIEKNFQYLVDKAKISFAEKIKIYNHVQFTTDLRQCTAEIIIEATAEIEDAKVALFNELANYNNEEVIFATNTSSFSISSLQEKIISPQRVIGMHFFNPAYIMKLVEVVKGNQTDDNIATAVVDICKQMNKEAVMCNDSSGFIVNRIARHYHLDSLKLAEDGIACYEDIDAILEATGFKMGPFKLIGLIGMDINLAVSQSLYNAFDKAERFKPSPLQIEKVKAGTLGIKSGKGFYKYPNKKI